MSEQDSSQMKTQAGAVWRAESTRGDCGVSGGVQRRTAIVVTLGGVECIRSRWRCGFTQPSHAARSIAWRFAAATPINRTPPKCFSVRRPPPACHWPPGLASRRAVQPPFPAARDRLRLTRRRLVALFPDRRTRGRAARWSISADQPADQNPYG